MTIQSVFRIFVCNPPAQNQFFHRVPSLVVAAVTGYLLGSIPFAYLIVRWSARLDLRTEWSGNVGTLNSYEVTGSKSVGMAVFALDFLKGVASVLAGREVAGGTFEGAALAGCAAVTGHNFPLWLRFRGGRGLAPAAGVWADTALDFMQMFLTMGGLLVIFGGILWAVGGLDNFLGMAGAQYPDYPFAMGPTEAEGYLGYGGHMGWFYYAAAWMAIGFGSIPAQDYLQRTCAAKNENVAVKSTYIAAFLYITFGVLSPFIGMAAHAVPSIGSEHESNASQFVLILMAMEYLHPVLTALFVAALASALMSTSDSSMLAGATMFTENIVKVFKPDLSDKTQLLLTRLALVVSGVLSLSIALWAETIYELAVDPPFNLSG